MNAALLIAGTPTANDALCQALAATPYMLTTRTTTASAGQALKARQHAGLLLDMHAPEINPVLLTQQAREAATPVAAFHVNDAGFWQAAEALGIDHCIEELPDRAAVEAWLADAPARTTSPVASSGVLGGDAAEIDGASALLIHDLKSPVSVIISSLEVLLTMSEDDPNADETVTRLMQGALHAAYRQIHLVTDLVDLTRLNLNLYNPEAGPCDLVRLIRECVNSEQYALETKGLKVEIKLPDAVLNVHAERDLLLRAIYNLIDNTLKFTVRSDILRIEAEAQGDRVVMRMTDSGRPILGGYEQSILHKAPQWQDRQAGTRTSVAMGLPFAYAVARQFNGTLTARSDLASRLTTFTLTFPAA